jgi:hypothetical protein
MRFTDKELSGLHKVPPGVLISHVLPFVGGVRNPESKVTALGNQLKRFLRITESTFNNWTNDQITIYTSVSCTIPPELTIYYNRAYIDRWEGLKSRIDRALDPGGNRPGQRYMQGVLSFSPEKLLEFWIYVDELTLAELHLVPVETLLLYIRAHPMQINYRGYCS